MAAEDSPTYCDSEKEVFFGKKKTQSELLKSTLLGQNYESPNQKCGTPRPKVGNLPDVINGSSKKSTDRVDSSSQDDDVIVIDDLSDSVQIISDDDDSLMESCNTNASRDSKELIPSQDKEVTENIENTNSLVEKKMNESRSAEENNGNGEIANDEDTSNNEDIIQNMNTSAAFSIAALIEASMQLEDQASGSVPVAKESCYSTAYRSQQEQSSLSNLDYSLLTGLSDSVLNISHGSTLPSPGLDPSNKSSLGLLANVVFEDISCDGDNLFETASEPSNKQSETHAAEVDLHMSVDENDQCAAPSLANTSQSTFYKTCVNDESNNIYFTANNTEKFSISSKPSTSFSNYRETYEDSVLLEADFVEDNEENRNETSFEAVLQNRQNSFPCMTEPVKTEVAQDKVKPKFVSKLPVFNSTTLLKPSLLQSQVKQENVKRNFKWAKNFPKTDTANVINFPTCAAVKEIPKRQLNRPIQVKTPNTKTVSTHSTNIKESEKKTPGKSVLTGLIKSATKTASASKIDSEKKTPGKTLLQQTNTPRSRVVTPSTQPSKLAKLERKTPKSVSTMSSEKKLDIKNVLLQAKDRYKNVISPVGAYISGAPIVLQRKVHVPEKQVLQEAESQIPVPTKAKTPTPIKPPRVVQKLNYGKAEPQDQENVDPNYARDTLPPRVFEAAAAVFMKDPEPPKRHLPKIGKTMEKLIDTPRPKVTIHQGRVKESPNTKGVLIPSVLLSTPNGSSNVLEPASRISVRITKPAENSGI